MHDVIIVGAGVAGCRLARNLKKDYLIIERSKDPGLKDSGHVSERFFSLYPDVKPLARNDEIEIAGREKSVVIRKEGLTYVIDRRKFGKHIRKGLEIEYANVERVERSGRGWKVITSKEEYKARILVGSDGANSVVRRSLGIGSPMIMVGVFGFSKKRPVKVYLRKDLSSHFLAWRTPIGEYGLADVKRPDIRKLERAENVRLRDLHYGIIPFGMTKLVAGNAALVGDAAGMVKPITGGGIIYSTLAADVLADAINNGRRLDEYERKVRRMFGREIWLGMVFRRIYPHLPQKAIDFMVGMLEFEGDFDYDFLSSFLKPFLKYKIEGVLRWRRRRG